jgi:hypothetical protein
MNHQGRFLEREGALVFSYLSMTVARHARAHVRQGQEVYRRHLILGRWMVWCVYAHQSARKRRAADAIACRRRRRMVGGFMHAHVGLLVYGLVRAKSVCLCLRALM